MLQCVGQQMLHYKLQNYVAHILPPLCATNVHVAERRSDAYFLQHANLLLAKVVTNATSGGNVHLQLEHLLPNTLFLVPGL